MATNWTRSWLLEFKNKFSWLWVSFSISKFCFVWWYCSSGNSENWKTERNLKKIKHTLKSKCFRVKLLCVHCVFKIQILQITVVFQFCSVLIDNFALKTDSYCWKAGWSLSQWKTLLQKITLCYCCDVHGLQRLSAFSLSILLLVHKGCYKYMFLSASCKSHNFNCKHLSSGVALQTIHWFCVI